MGQISKTLKKSRPLYSLNLPTGICTSFFNLIKSKINKYKGNAKNRDQDLCLSLEVHLGSHVEAKLVAK